MSLSISAQRKNTWLACMRPWVPFPAMQKDDDDDDDYNKNK
jgi:hypothetical protein